MRKTKKKNQKKWLTSDSVCPSLNCNVKINLKLSIIFSEVNIDRFTIITDCKVNLYQFQCYKHFF